MDFNIWILPVAALIPLIAGAIWYNPKVFGSTWLRLSGLTAEEVEGGNMVRIFGLTYVLGLFLSAALLPMVIHQTGMLSLVAADPTFGQEGSEVSVYFANFMETYGDKHRDFGHGAFHGFFGGLIFAMPLIGIISLYERRGFKYIAIHSGYWILTLALMGGVIAQFA